MNQRAEIVPAAQVGLSFSSDAEMTLPERPRLVPELHVFPFGRDGMIVDGAGAPQVLGGASARVVLPRLMRLLDGTRSLDEIAAALPRYSATAIRDAVWLLYSRGLLEDGASPAPPPELADMDAFLGRFIDVTRVNRNRGEALARLASARLAIVGSPGGAARVADALAGAGFGEIAIGDRDDATLVVAVATDPQDDLDRALDDAWERGVRALQIRVGSDGAEIGPLFVPGKSGCHRCLRAIYPEVPAHGEDSDVAELFLGIGALAAFHIVSGIGDAHLYNVQHRLAQTPHGTVLRDRIAARLPGCDRCGIAGPELDPESPAGRTWLLHCSLAMPPRELLTPRTHQNHYSSHSVALARQLPEPYHGGVTVSLSAPDLLRVPPPWRTARSIEQTVGLPHVTTLCAYAAGYREIAAGTPWRVAPTGGAIGSPELFVVASGAAGLDDGVYHYHGPRHALERLRDVSSDQIRSALGTSAPLPPIVIVSAGALAKVRRKYGSFAYRVVNLDAGVALAYLHEVAAALGLPVVEYPDIADEALSDLVGVARVGHRHVITFALGVGAVSEPASEALSGRVLDDVIDAAVVATRPGQPQRPVWPGGPVHAFAAERDEPGPSLGEVFLQRRSVRDYADAPVPTRWLQEMMVSAVDLGRRRLSAGAPDDVVRPWLAVARGDGDIAPGIYAVDLDRPALLVPVTAGLSHDALARCILQTGLARGAAALFFTGDLGDRLQARGPRGYRELLVSAGAQAARAILVAVSRGVAACPSGGILEDGFRELTRTDGYRTALLFSLALGMPVPA
jgi:SagB-type dehydrogenase family enzyme